jgi:hypothetical protein
MREFGTFFRASLLPIWPLRPERNVLDLGSSFPEFKNGKRGLEVWLR